MKKIILLALLSLSLCGYLSENKELGLYLKENAPFEIYEPEENPFKDLTEEELQDMFTDTIDYPEDIEVEENEELANSLPSSYDFRKTWKTCNPKVRAQLKCGSCWSFAGSTALAYRFCQKSKGKVKVTLSPQDSVSCDKTNRGCNGGSRLLAWKYYAQKGIVTDSCFPYSSGKGKVEKCITKCKNGEKWKKYKAKNVKEIQGVTNIKNELVNNGPVHASFLVYEDFMSYKGSIYIHVAGRALGSHAIVIVGYGSQNGVNYWICQNSWGKTWAENGYFRIKMGECGINSNAVVGLPVL